MINRAPERTAWTAISNVPVDDQRLSFKDLGLLVRMLRKPDGWIFYVDQMATWGPDGKTAIYSSLRNLEACGYIRRIRDRKEDGSYVGLDIEVFEEPQLDNPVAENLKVDLTLKNEPSGAGKTTKATSGKPSHGNSAVSEETNTANTEEIPSAGDLAQTILKTFWDAAVKKPNTKPIAILARITDALEGGWSAEEISTALPTMTAYTAAAFDFALHKLDQEQSAKPQSPEQPERHEHAHCDLCDGLGRFWDEDARELIPCFADLTKPQPAATAAN